MIDTARIIASALLACLLIGAVWYWKRERHLIGGFIAAVCGAIYGVVACAAAITLGAAVWFVLFG